jgi:1,4-dihydroxy-2-naphthoyl-CoA hydrolase
MSEHRETLGMPDILDEYPVPGPRTLDGTLGIRVTELEATHARGTVPYSERICQRFGVVHGGVYAALAEAVATEGTVHNVWDQGYSAMGSSNSTSFLRPVTEGNVHATAHAKHRGRTTWVWEVDMTDDSDRLCAVSRVTVAVRPRSEA